MQICKISVVFFILLNSNLFGGVFFNTDSVSEIRIYFHKHDWDKQLDEYKLSGSSERILADVIIDGVELKNTGVKFKGNSSYNQFYKKNPYNIDVNYKDKNQRFKGLRKIKLSNIFRDPSAIREVLAYEIAGKYMTAPEAKFAEVYVNDTLKGLYVMTEAIDKTFMKKHFGLKKGIRFKCDILSPEKCPACPHAMSSTLLLGFTEDSTCYYNAYELKSKYGWTKLIELLKYIWFFNDEKSVYYNKLDSVLNIERAIRMLAFNNLFVNLDSYSWSGHNYYLIEDSSGKFNTVIWDLNMCFGGFSMGYKSELHKLPVFLNIENKYKPLIKSLLSRDEYRKKYIAHYKYLIEEIVEAGYFKKRAKELHQLISLYIKKDPWFYYDDEVFNNSLYKDYYDIPALISLMSKRKKFLNSTAIFDYEELIIKSPKLTANDSLINFSVETENINNVYFYYKTNGGTFFKKLKMNKLLNCYNVSIPIKNYRKICYYIYAENEEAGKYYPSGGSFTHIKKNF